MVVITANHPTLTEYLSSFKKDITILLVNNNLAAIHVFILDENEIVNEKVTLAIHFLTNIHR